MESKINFKSVMTIHLLTLDLSTESIKSKPGPVSKESMLCRLLAYGGVYTGLEIFAVPAVPLTMTAGVIFGTVPGVIVVSAASTAAATLSFLIARYAARDRVQRLFIFAVPT